MIGPQVKRNKALLNAMRRNYNLGDRISLDITEKDTRKQGINQYG